MKSNAILTYRKAANINDAYSIERDGQRIIWTRILDDECSEVQFEDGEYALVHPSEIVIAEVITND